MIDFSTVTDQGEVHPILPHGFVITSPGLAQDTQLRRVSTMPEQQFFLRATSRTCFMVPSLGYLDQSIVLTKCLNVSTIPYLVSNHTYTATAIRLDEARIRAAELSLKLYHRIVSAPDVNGDSGGKRCVAQPL